MERVLKFNVVRKGKYSVCVDGQIKSSHNEEKDAIESLINNTLANTDSTVELLPYDKMLCEVDEYTISDPVEPETEPEVEPSSNLVLTEPSRVSAGVFNSDGNLIRTLFSNEFFETGTHDIIWDSFDDDGNVVNDITGYYIEAVSHNVEYNWEGTIGHSGPFNSDRLFAMRFPSDFTTYGTKGYMAMSDCERRRSIEGVDLSNWKKFFIGGTEKQYRSEQWLFTSLITSDDSRVYVATQGTDWTGGGAENHYPFIGALDINDIEAYGGVGFTNGTDVSEINRRSSWTKAIPLTWNTERPTGLAVDDTNLYVSIGEQNLIRVFNKISGDFVRDLSINSPERLVVQGDNLWVIAEGNVNEIDKVTGTVNFQITSLSDPLALALHPNNNLYVVDSGDNQQIRIFSDGVPVSTFGVQGGYAASTEVASNKFSFGSYAFIEITDSGDIYVGDTGNSRVLLFDTNFVLNEEHHMRPTSYYMAVDHDDPTRVYSDFLEYEVDYSKPLLVDQGWKLKRNWSSEISRLQNEGSTFTEGIQSIVSFTSNGVTRKYLAMVIEGTPDQYTGDTQHLTLFEQVDDNTLRKTKQSRFRIGYDDVNEPGIYPDGWRHLYDSSGHPTHDIMLEEFTGFDEDNDPTFASPIILAQGVKGNSPAGKGSTRTGLKWPSTSDGKVIFFNGSVQSSDYQGMHLGAVAEGESEWSWKANPTGNWEVVSKKDPITNKDRAYWGSVTTKDGSFYASNPNEVELKAAGNKVHVVDNHIICGHHGEFFSPDGAETGQSNQFLHWTTNGLFIGQCGEPSYAGQGYNWRNGAGNSFSNEFIKYGDNLYLYHNDEGTSLGVHRWKITNLESMKIHTISLPTV